MSTWESLHDMNWKEQLCYDMGYRCGKNDAVVNGAWNSGRHGDFKCSICKEDGIEEAFKFCPHCGAKMY